MVTLSAGFKQVIVGAAVDCSLFSSVRRVVHDFAFRSVSAPGRLLLASASVSLRERRTHTTCCNVRPWFRQGLGCLNEPLARPLSHVLRVVWADQGRKSR